MGRGLRLYLDKAHSLLGGQGQPFIQDGGGSGVSPAGTGPCRPGPQGRAEVTQAPGSHLSRLLLRSPSVGPVRSQLLPPLQAPSEGRLPWHLSPCCLLAQSPHPCRPVPTGTEGQSLSSSQPKELQPLLPPAFPQFPTCRSMAALLPTPAASPSRAPHFLRTHRGGGGEGYRRILGTAEGRCRNRVKEIWARIPAVTLRPHAFLCQWGCAGTCLLRPL